MLCARGPSSRASAFCGSWLPASGIVVDMFASPERPRADIRRPSDEPCATGAKLRRSRNNAQSSNAAISPKVEAANNRTFPEGNLLIPLISNAFVKASPRAITAVPTKTVTLRGIFMNCEYKPIKSIFGPVPLGALEGGSAGITRHLEVRQDGTRGDYGIRRKGA